MIKKEIYMSKANSNNVTIEQKKKTRKTLQEELEGMTYEEMGEFFDTHSMADYWEDTQEVELSVVHSPRSRKYRDARKAKEAEQAKEVVEKK